MLSASCSCLEVEIAAANEPNVAPFATDRVTSVGEGTFMVSLTYEGWNIYGKPDAKIALYRVRCSAGICMVLAGPE